MTQPVPDAPPAPRLAGEVHRDPQGVRREASMHNLIDALAPDSGVRLAFDTFRDQTMIGTPDGQWRPFADRDVTAMRAQLERHGFRSVGKENMRDAAKFVAMRQPIDTLREYCDALVWDGKERVDTMLHDHFGVEQTAHHCAVGAYLMTALAGRALAAPIQADMVPILIGGQGAGKSSAVRALAPSPSAFGTVDLTKRDADLSRQLRGKSIVEWAEMRGLGGRDHEGIKDWITRRTEEWVEKFDNFATAFHRRCIVVATSNRIEILSDETGERRMLPVAVGKIDIEALAANRDQLWAEGVARFKEFGIAWEAAEYTARQEHQHFKVSDEWDAPIAAWLAALPVPRFGDVPSPIRNGDAPFLIVDLCREALRIDAERVSLIVRRRVGAVLQRMGYRAQAVRSKAVVARQWVRDPRNA